jgi:hypothetical protein
MSHSPWELSAQCKGLQHLKLHALVRWGECQSWYGYSEPPSSQPYTFHEIPASILGEIEHCEGLRALTRLRTFDLRISMELWQPAPGQEEFMLAYADENAEQRRLPGSGREKLRRRLEEGYKKCEEELRRVLLK